MIFAGVQFPRLAVPLELAAHTRRQSDCSFQFSAVEREAYGNLTPRMRD
jgi:hypothetical protein